MAKSVPIRGLNNMKIKSFRTRWCIPSHQTIHLRKSEKEHGFLTDSQWNLQNHV